MPHAEQGIEWLDFFIKGGGWAAFMISLVVFWYLWNWRDKDVFAMRKAHGEAVNRYETVIEGKDNDLKIAQETIKELYKDNAETLGENLTDVVTCLTNAHNSNQAVAAVLEKVKDKM